MVAGVRVSGWVIAGGLIASLSTATIALAQSNGPSTTGGALPYITGTPVPPRAAEPPATAPSAPAATAATPATPPPPAVRVIDLSKKDPAAPNAPSTPSAPAATTVTAPAPTPAPIVAATPEAPKVDFTPVAPSGSDLIAATPPIVDAPRAATAAPVLTPVTPPAPAALAPAAPPAAERPIAEVPKPKARPKSKITSKPQPNRRQQTARVERFDQDIEVDVEAPVRRPDRLVRTPRLAGYDAWGRPIYYMPDTPSRDRRWVSPRYRNGEWLDEEPARLRPLPPIGALRPFPPQGSYGSFRSQDCRVVFYSDEFGRTRRDVRCR